MGASHHLYDLSSALLISSIRLCTFASLCDLSRPPPHPIVVLAPAACPRRHQRRPPFPLRLSCATSFHGLHHDCSTYRLLDHRVPCLLSGWLTTSDISDDPVPLVFHFPAILPSPPTLPLPPNLVIALLPHPITCTTFLLRFSSPLYDCVPSPLYATYRAPPHPIVVLAPAACPRRHQRRA